MPKKIDCQFTFIGVVVMFLLYPLSSFSQTDYSVLDYWNYYSDAANQLYKQQSEISFEILAKRKESISKLKTKTDWEGRQQLVKEKLQESIGDFPAKTPLNPVITQRIKKDGYSIDKLYFESMPGVKVTAAFFIPNGKRKNLPTIIYCSGHSDLAFRSDIYQHVILNLVKKGFAVFAFDPYGQGERLQYFDQNLGKSRFSPTREHSYPGAQLFINGASTAKYMIWDGIRAVDYLLTRKEVDSKRIGITGRSGGGTQTAQIAALDERIMASAPECYITTMEYQLKSGGPQDAEQNLPSGIQLGLDHADLLEVRVPKPTLMITTTRDMFSIQGARDTYQEAQLAYKAFGKEENIMMVEDNAGHQSTMKNREAMYAFFQKHLDNPGNSKDEEVVVFPVEELYVTETGQLSTSVGSKFLFDVNSASTAKNMEILEEGRRNMDQHLTGLKQKVQAISGYSDRVRHGKLIFSGQTEFETYILNKYLIVEEGNKIIPFVTFVPKKPVFGTALYLDNMDDKESDIAYAIPIQLAKKGVTVIVPDMPGHGELGPGYLKGDAYFENTSYNQWFAGILNGKSTVAIHVEAITTLLEVCKSDLKLDDKEFMGISKGPFNSSLLHAAVSGVEFSKMLLLDPMLSFESIVSEKDYDPSLIPFTVAGALPHYDLQDLSAAFAPNKLMLVQEADGQAKDSSYMQSYDFVKEHYKSLNKANNFSVEKMNFHEGAMDSLDKFISNR
ncbi:xylan esterase [Arenibacter sp. N53]|uniref:alpha/beta hydrolase family protein n=1 Tax=Arenibacter TaxID=178469 RepID=UPI000CD3D9A1|nr:MULTISPECIES: acetylxylan esterase [Arenibacter]MCM4153994.1 xylan esterase [Arenibacter sp. N53]